MRPPAGLRGRARRLRSDRHLHTLSGPQARAALLGAGVDEVMADAIMALRATALDSFTSVIHPDVEQITGRPARTFREWARDHRAEFE
ncbi:hypothetical protein IRT45_22975 [Nocardia sp. BSTN01]|uniref:hypothetical protein n=1 Tax=Nocardia sp. BSTN01 TaxID=2783665 RepID=UPI00188E5549|nr:hypothetical protein [Nocardia sp. BSTN01]MBF5000011.1 hypothetical protein [Nocardia sp. BSTN01]